MQNTARVTCDLTSPDGLRRAAHWATTWPRSATFVPWGDARRDLRLERDGVELWNARAVAALSTGPWAWLVRRSWLAAEVAEALWSLRAWLAPLIALLTLAFRGPSLATPGLARTRSLVIRVVGIATIAAAWSWWRQIDGLVGSAGISPTGEWLEAVRAYATRHGKDAFEIAPTWLWLDSSDAALHLTCGLAVVGGALMALGIVPGIGALLGFAAYLSLVVTGGIFMGYQWDALLLEALVVAALLAPWTRLTLGRARDLEPGRVVVLLARLVAFKLYFMSGLVKVLSQDPVWADLTALDFHFWTQPLPLPASWLVMDAPAWVSSALCGFTLFAELVLPWALLLPASFRRMRIVATLLMMSLQLGIAATGNYGYFNLLSLGILAIGLDDLFVRPWGVWERARARGREAWRVWVRVPAGLAAALLAVLTVFEVRAVWLEDEQSPSVVTELAKTVGPFRVSNTYGLFANMTTERPEIEIQGSYDGSRWSSYSFRWKPDAERVAPPWAGLHMPRLDWQLWFAALRHDCLSRDLAWYQSFLQKLLEGAPEVTALLAGNPFPADPPKYIRSLVWQYTPVVEESGRWWAKSDPRTFCPDVTLRNGRLQRADIMGDAAGR